MAKPDESYLDQKRKAEKNTEYSKDGGPNFNMHNVITDGAYFRPE